MVAMSQIELFDSKGTMLPLDQIAPQLESADDATRERFETLRAAYDEVTGIEAAIKSSERRVIDLVAEIGEVESELRKHYPAQSEHQAIRAFLQTERAKYGAR